MADPAAIRTALGRLGFSQAAAAYIVDVQEINELEEIRVMTDDELSNLCKVTRRPGGTIPNPDAGEPGQPATLPNPGLQVSMRAENNLKLAAFWLRHRVRISRTPTPAMLTLENVRSLRSLRDTEEAHENPTEYPKINDKDWPKTVEAIKEFLRSNLGETKVPLAYVIRGDVDVPAVEDDPADNDAMKQDEMISRAPHGTEVFQADNQQVWAIMSQITKDHSCWTYVKSAQRARDGRRAFQLLYNHYLGPDNVDNLSNAAESRLMTLEYKGEGRRWNFEMFTHEHVEQHSILEGLVEHGYAGIDDRSKVRLLLNGIKTDTLDAVKTRIMSDETLRSNFDGCVSLFQTFLKQSKLDNLILNVSEVNAGDGKRGRDDGDDDVDIEDRYYTPDEYSNLTPGEKNALRKKRRKRKGKKSGDSEEDSKNEIGEALKALSALTALVTKLTDEE